MAPNCCSSRTLAGVVPMTSHLERQRRIAVLRNAASLRADVAGEVPVELLDYGPAWRW
jgi:hypothetical protein